MAKSWEFYQQPETGPDIPYPLWWLCGAGTSLGVGAPGFVDTNLNASFIYAVPFNQLRAVTVNKMAISVSQLGGAGARCRVGIYNNASDANSKPTTIVVEAGEVDLSAGDLGTRTLTGFSVNLDADTRYWAVLLTNANAAAAKIKFLAKTLMLFWGFLDFQGVTHIEKNQGNYAAGLPLNFPAVNQVDLVGVGGPAIALAFSSVT